ncbi:MAG: hypothetical protein ACREM6_06805 [Vulcanimicrobiaceae bacterium]
MGAQPFTTHITGKEYGMSDWANVVQLLREADESRATRHPFLALAATGLGTAASAVPALGRAAESRKLTNKFGYTATQTNPVAVGYEKFKSLVEQRSNSNITVATFCCNQLGGDLDLIQGAKSGAHRGHSHLSAYRPARRRFIASFRRHRDADDRIGMLMPSIGITLLVSASILNTPIDRVARNVVPYVLAVAVDLFIVILYPPIATWLPAVAHH